MSEDQIRLQRENCLLRKLVKKLMKLHDFDQSDYILEAFSELDQEALFLALEQDDICVVSSGKMFRLSNSAIFCQHLLDRYWETDNLDELVLIEFETFPEWKRLMIMRTLSQYLDQLSRGDPPKLSKYMEWLEGLKLNVV